MRSAAFLKSVRELCGVMEELKAALRFKNMPQYFIRHVDHCRFYTPAFEAHPKKTRKPNKKNRSL
jgi:hypothetical protein